MCIRDKIISSMVILILVVQFLPFFNAIIKPDQQNFVFNPYEETLINEIPRSRSTRSSIWLQTSDNDFNNGTLDNITIVGTEKNAELRLIDIELNEWIEKTPPNSPLERQFHTLAPIWGTDKILLFGGLRGSNPLLNDTWIYDLSENKWIEKYPANHPSKRYYHAMASVWGTDKIVLMGGGENISNILNDTWIYDYSSNTWTDVTNLINPGKIYQQYMATIYGDDKVVLFGGGDPKNKTWVYDLSDNEWTFKTPANSPPSRIAHSMTSIWGTDKVLLFGGVLGSTSSYNDSWIYDLSENNWTNMAYGPPGRFQHDIATIYGTDKVILFGGFNWSNGDINDTWIYDFSENTWTQIFSKNDPGKRLSHLMSSVWGTDKIVLFSGARGPLINDTWIFDPFEYVDKGTFTSSPYDIGSNSSFKTIFWIANLTTNTSVKFQLRTAEIETSLKSKDFVGPGGSSISYYIFSPTDIWSGYNSDRWIQYKAYLSTTNSEETPRLKNVTITYNYWPNTTLISPLDGDITNNNKPTFNWNFTDSDSAHQTAFQVLIDEDIEFQSIDHNSSDQYSSNLTWQFPNGTNYSELSEGIWYWKVRTKDNDGDWSVYSQPWKVIIDTTAPTSIIIVPFNGFNNNLDMISGIASDSLDGTGLNKVEIAINRLIDNSYWTGQKWIDSETWLITSGTIKWSYDTSSVIWHSGFKYNIQSRATDSATNVEIPKTGKNFIMDFDNVTFSNTFPSYNDVSTTEDVEVGITISDQISGVNASTIEYSTSVDNGVNWTSWEPVIGLESGRTVNITLNLTFPNGTANRIKWRASDIAGNGPTESKAYSIKVNTWLQTLIPRVRLWSPPNGSTIPTKSVKLQWFLENTNLVGVTYDLYFDNIPPTEPNFTGLDELSYNLDDLIDGETYYWTVIPRTGSEEGICTSGIWSFTIDTRVAYPTVKLLRPENGSIVSSTKPTFAWTTEYYGTETLFYDVYLDSQPGLITFQEAFNPYYLPSTLLEDNQTYYWKVVPKAGSIVGPESEIWSFTVKKDYIPHFELELKVESDGIVMEPASIKNIKAFVTNKGELTDKISLSIEIPSDSEMGGIVNEPNILESESGETVNFSIMLTTTQNIEAGEVIITVTATSGEALDFGIDYEEELKVKVIIFVEEEVKPEESSEWLYFWSILIIIIVIILALLILILFRRRKQEQEIKVKAEKEIDTSKSLETPPPEQAQETSPKNEVEIKEPQETSKPEKDQVESLTAEPEVQVPPAPTFDDPKLNKHQITKNKQIPNPKFN